MAINPENVDTVTIPQLATATLALTNFFAHSAPNGKLGKATINGLAIYLAPYIASVGASAFVPVSGSVLPNPANNPAFTIVGKKTLTQTTGGSVNATGDLNVLSWNGTTWTLIEAITLSTDYITFEQLLENSYSFDFDETNFANGIYLLSENAIVPSTDNSWEYIQKDVFGGASVELTSVSDSLTANGVLFIFDDEDNLLDAVYPTAVGTIFTVTYIIQQKGKVIGQYRRESIDNIGNLKISSDRIFATIEDAGNTIPYISITDNPSTVKMPGKLIQQDGTIVDFAPCDTYKLPVLKGNQVKLVGDTNFNTPGETNAIIFQFDSDDNFVAKIGFSSIANGVSREVEAEAIQDGFVYMWFININGIPEAIFKRDFKYKYIPYTMIDDLNGGKPKLEYNLALFGDSITAPYNNVWANIITDYILFKTINNYARGSATWRNRTDTAYNITDTAPTSDDDNVIWNQYNRLVNDVEVNGKPVPDIVAIFGGTNDFNSGSPIWGDFDAISAVADVTILNPNDNVVKTIFGAIRYTTDLLRKKWPQVTIILASPNQSRYLSGIPGENPPFFYSFRNNMEKAATYTACKFIDQQRSGINYYQETPGARVNLGDGLHPSGPGIPRLAKFICNELHTLLKI